MKKSILLFNKNKKVHCRAPLRLGLAGGGTDVSPYSDKYGGCVLNATIDLYAHAIIEPGNKGKTIFVSVDHQKTLEYSDLIKPKLHQSFQLHCAIHRYFVKKYNRNKKLPLKLITFADVPAGSGLGTSSTLVVCILKAYCTFLNINLSEYEIANLAYKIERIELKMDGGKQDQYAAAFGGFNFMEFGTGSRLLINPLRIKKWVVNELETSLVLYFTGQSRDSALIIKDQINNANTNNHKFSKAMHNLKKDAFEMKEAILLGKIKKISYIFSRSWKSKQRLSKKISNKNISKILRLGKKAGALSGKVSGAGGGGFIMFFVPVEYRLSLINFLNQLSGKVVNFHFVSHGAEAWTVENK